MLYKFFCRLANSKLKFQIRGGKIFYEVKLEFSSQPSGSTNLKFFELKHFRILFSLNPHYRYVVRYSLKCLMGIRVSLSGFHGVGEEKTQINIVYNVLCTHRCKSLIIPAMYSLLNKPP